MSKPPKKKQFIINNYDSFKKLIRWTYTPVSISISEIDPEEIIVHFDSSVSKNDYMLTINHMLHLFPQLPSIMEYTRTNADDVSSVKMSRKAFTLLKLTSYSQYIMPGNLEDDMPPSLTDVPQFPHLIRMFATRDTLTSPFAIDSFVRVLRAWMAFAADDIYYVKDVDYLNTDYRDRSKIFSKLPAILEIIFQVFDQRAPDFLEFLRINAVGASVIYNFLFLTEIDLFHSSFLTEIREYMKPNLALDPNDGDTKGFLAGRYISFLIMIEGIAAAKHNQAGYAKLDSCENKSCCSNLMVLKLQFFAFLCDSKVSPVFALMMMCLFTSSKMSPVRNAAMLRFAAALKTKLYSPTKTEKGVAVKLYDDTRLSIQLKRSKLFYSAPGIKQDSIEYMNSVATVEAPTKLFKAKNMPLYPLHLFVSSLEESLYPNPGMRLGALPLVGMYLKRSKVFPFETTRSLEDVFFLAKSHDDLLKT